MSPEASKENVVPSENNDQGASPVAAHEPRVFLIPSDNLPKFQERFEKLAKRAAKIGCEIPTFSILKEEIRNIQVVVDEVEDDFGRVKQIIGNKPIVIHHIKIHSSEVIVAGYEFAATIDHSDEGNILHVRRGFAETIPHKYRDCSAWCDHCKTKRRRLDTFVVRHVESNNYLQIGRNCLADFLGRDAERFAAIAEIYLEADELGEASESESYGEGGARSQFDYLDKFLACVAEVILLEGWRSNTTAKEYGGTSTSSEAQRHLHPSKKDVQENKLLFRAPSEKSVQTANDAIAWCQAISDQETDTSDYLYNIRTIARRGIVGNRQYGYAASIISGYLKHVGDLKRKEKFIDRATISQFVGEEGEHVVVQVLIEKVLTWEGYGGGATYFHIMSDKNGNCLNWASSGEKLEENSEVLLKGTVKKHELYYPRDRFGQQSGVGIKQTKLTRCKVIQIKTFSLTIGDINHQVLAEDDKAARKLLLPMFGIARLPKGCMILEVPTVEKNSKEEV